MNTVLEVPAVTVHEVKADDRLLVVNGLDSFTAIVRHTGLASNPNRRVIVSLDNPKSCPCYLNTKDQLYLLERRAS